MTAFRSRSSLALRAAISLVCFAVAALAGLACWQWNAPLDAPLIFPLSETYYTRAIAAQAPAEKISWANKAVKTAPARAENWVLMAYAYQSQDHALSSRVIDALRQSYAVAPLSPNASDWRLAYVFSNWSLMPADLRDQGRKEAQAYMTDTTGSAYLNKLTPTLPDREGRFVLGLLRLDKTNKDRAAWIDARREREAK